MKKSMMGLAVLLAWALALPGPPPAEAQFVGRIVFLTAKPGAKAQLEQALKDHMEWRRQQKDEWQWIAWEYVTDRTQGRYAVATFGHLWVHFDEPKVSPWVEEAENGGLAALCESPPVVQYFEHLDRVSRPGHSDQAPALAEVVVFQVHFGKSAQFYATLPKIAQVMDRYKSPVRFEWFELHSGGETPAFMAIVPYANWSGLEMMNESVMDQMVMMLGKAEARAVIEQLGSSVRSQRRDLVRLRYDLSYSGASPAAAGK